MDEAERIAKQLKPPTCPKCGMELDELINVQEEWVTFYFSVDDDGNVDYVEDDRCPGNTSEYECPYCHEVLFNNEDDARDFLMGKVDNDK
jgi:hypothetical protein